MFKGKILPGTNVYCKYLNSGTDACVPCEDGTEKLGWGDDKDLCKPVVNENNNPDDDGENSMPSKNSYNYDNLNIGAF